MSNSNNDNETQNLPNAEVSNAGMDGEYHEPPKLLQNDGSRQMNSETKFKEINEIEKAQNMGFQSQSGKQL